jgi:fructosamine-3-kinase
MLPEPLAQAVTAVLRKAGDAVPLRAIEPTTGGYANRSVRLATGRTSYLLKWDEKQRLGMFPAEARRHVCGQDFERR